MSLVPTLHPVRGGERGVLSQGSTGLPISDFSVTYNRLYLVVKIKNLILFEIVADYAVKPTH